MNIPRTNALYVAKNGDILKIVNVNKKLLEIAVWNKAITVQFLNDNYEMHISLETFNFWECKYIGKNLKAAQILYGYNYSREKNYAEIDYDYAYRLAAAIAKSEDDQGSGS